MKHPNQEFLQRNQDLAKPLGEADKTFFTKNIHIYRFYFLTSVVVVLFTEILMFFITDHVRLKALVTGSTIFKILPVEAMVQRNYEFNVH